MAVSKYDESESEKPIEQVVTDFAKFTKEKETREFIGKWNAKGYKKVGIAELLFKVWLLSGSKKNSRALLRDASELLEKLKGEGGWFSFLGDMKLTAEKILKK